MNYIEWKFKCLSCGYKFRAIEPVWLFKKFGDSCWICGSKDIEKKVITEDFKWPGRTKSCVQS